jgi:glycosyltransferase involved in cell wall biosynthesis
MFDNNPLVSVIMPCLNSEKTIGASIESLQNQTYKNFELIIVDDGSKDKSFFIAESYSRLDFRLKVLKNDFSPKGVAFARNVGLKLAKGKYIAFLDSDDLCEPESLMLRVNTALSKKALVVYGNFKRLFEDGSYRFVRVKTKINYFDMLSFNYISNTTGMYDAEVLGLFLQEPIGHEDYLMWCKLIQKAGVAFSCGELPIGIYRVSKNSLSSNKFKSFLWHWIVVYEKLETNFILALFFQTVYFIKSLLLRFQQSFFFSERIR